MSNQHLPKVMVSNITQHCCCPGRWHLWGVLPLMTLMLAACSSQPQDKANKSFIKIGVIAFQAFTGAKTYG